MSKHPPCRTAAVFLSVSLAVALVAPHAAAAPPVEPGAGDTLGALEFQDLDGKPVSVASLRGKTVVLNFWATWCRPCMEEMPLLADLATRYGKRGLVVIAASVDEAESRGDVARVAAALPDGMKVWVGATPDDMQRLKLGIAVPATLLLDGDGQVVVRQRGALTAGALDEQIETLLEREGTPKRLPDAIQAKANSGTGTDFARVLARQAAGRSL